MNTEDHIETEIKSFLSSVFNKDCENELKVKFLKDGTGKGDGYIGNVVFVDVEQNTPDGLTKTFHLALKCSPQDESVRESLAVQDGFLNEMYIYASVFPAFTKFQIDRGIDKPFNSVPKFYGKYARKNLEIIALENLNIEEYALWEKTQPLPRKHLEMVLTEYAKFHATSVAMKDQEPENFNQLISGLQPAFKNFFGADDATRLFTYKIEQSHKLLQGILEEKILVKWKNFATKVKSSYARMWNVDQNDVKVIAHGDCWNNNFMFKHQNGDHGSPLKFAMLDWQLSIYSSPILDVAYFIFSCVSEADIKDLDNILLNYYKTFASYLNRLGSKAETLYPQKQFFTDWKKYPRFGITMISLIMFLCSTTDDEILDLAKPADKEKQFSSSFSYDLKDPSVLKHRMAYIVKYVVENDLV